MTREEAIKFLNYIADEAQSELEANRRIWTNQKRLEALSMAIAALREQEAIARNLHDVASNEQVTEPLRPNGFGDFGQSLATKNQVTSDCGSCNFRNNHLISVDEQLPEEAIRVLVHLSGTNPPIGFPRMDTDRIIDGRWVRWGDLVTHWMPLPDPPKET